MTFTDINLQIGQRIRERREELGMSQNDLAELVGYTSRSTIARIEAGEIDLPQSKISAIAKALMVDPKYIFGWTGEAPEIDEDLMVLREQLRRSPETRMLFDVTKNATPEQIKAVAEMLKQWRSTSD